MVNRFMLTSEEVIRRVMHAQVTVFEAREAEVTNRQLCPDGIYRVCVWFGKNKAE